MTYLTLAQAAKLIPTSGGKPPSTMTIYRWATRGVNGIRLKHMRFGRRICVTNEDLAEFARALAEVWLTPRERKARTAKPAEARTPKPRTAAQREKAVAAAEARLKARGCMSENRDE